MMSNSAKDLRLLWIDMTHDRSTAALMTQFLDLAECQLTTSAECQLERQPAQIDMICMHFDQPDARGLTQLQRLRRSMPSVPITMFTVRHSEELAVWAMRSRVWEYITLPLSDGEMSRYRRALAELHALRNSSSAGARRAPTEMPELPTAIRLTSEHRKHQSLQPALQHIDRNFRETIDQKELALLCGMTPSRFSRLFKDVFGVCYLEYVLGKRMEFAKEQLHNSRMSITTVGYEAGFRDPSYFARAFKQLVGCTPSEYRSSAYLAACNAVRDLAQAQHQSRGPDAAQSALAVENTALKEAL